MADDGGNASPSPDRSELLEHAKNFLQSAPVQQQDISAKKQFLVEKGLSEPDITSLLTQTPSHLPLIPPRTYPQPAPSNLLNLIVGIFRLFSWVAGGSAILVLVYQRLLLPRISRTLAARSSLRAHHIELLKKFDGSLRTFQEKHAETMAILPHPVPYLEPSPWKECRTVSDVLKSAEDQDCGFNQVPPVTFLRCTIQDWTISHQGQSPSTQQLFQVLEGHIPWLASEDGHVYEEHLWNTLNTCSLFSHAATAPSSLKDALWIYTSPLPQADPEVLASLSKLGTLIPKRKEYVATACRDTHKALTDFTGYISSQTYTSSYGLLPGGRVVGSGALTPQQDEVRREIRALKGLVLNRRSFMK